jgi:type VI secretion system protein VasI
MNIMKATNVLAVVITVSMQQATAAVDEKAYAKCAATNGDLSRLDCYDQLAVAEGLVKKTNIVEVNDSGKWDISLNTNPIDDSKTVILSLNADSGGTQRKPVTLFARCKSDTKELYISWNDYLGRNSMVLTRIGKEKASTVAWGLSTDSKATFYGGPIEFIKGMMKANTLIAQVTPYNDSPITAVFDTSGLSNAIKPLRETCHW